MQEYRAHGKVLISGEYGVLAGAKALAIPTLFGQSLIVEEQAEKISWESIDFQGHRWFSATYDLALNLIQSSDNDRAIFIQKILAQAQLLSTTKATGYHFCSRLEFKHDWGLGSSSTLTHLIAQHYHINPFDLFFDTQNGSGYDIACASATGAITYQLIDSKPDVKKVKLPAAFHDAYFVYLGQKQDSRREVARFKEGGISHEYLGRISALTEEFLEVKSSSELQLVMLKHEDLLSKILGRSSLQQSHFQDFNGAIKSLGAWGGDFIMAVGVNASRYFLEKAFSPVFSFDELFGKLIDK